MDWQWGQPPQFWLSSLFYVGCSHYQPVSRPRFMLALLGRSYSPWVLASVFTYIPMCMHFSYSYQQCLPSNHYNLCSVSMSLFLLFLNMAEGLITELSFPVSKGLICPSAMYKNRRNEDIKGERRSYYFFLNQSQSAFMPHLHAHSLKLTSHVLLSYM